MEIVRFEDSSWISEDGQDCRVHMINFREVLIEIMLALKKKSQERSSKFGPSSIAVAIFIEVVCPSLVDLSYHNHFYAGNSLQCQKHRSMISLQH